MNLEIINNKHEGLLFNTRTEFPLANIRIPIPDISQEIYNTGKVRIPFKIQGIKKTGLLKDPTPEKIQQCEISYF